MSPVWKRRFIGLPLLAFVVVAIFWPSYNFIFHEVPAPLVIFPKFWPNFFVFTSRWFDLVSAPALVFLLVSIALHEEKYKGVDSAMISEIVMLIGLSFGFISGFIFGIIFGLIAYVLCLIARWLFVYFN